MGCGILLIPGRARRGFTPPHPVRRREGFQNFPRVPIEAKEGQPFHFIDEPRRCHG
jgi:hypothetical protein